MKIPTLNAHALGGWHGRTFVNSKEAFLSAYRKGFRDFEVDISCTNDGFFVAKHGSTVRESYSKDDFLANSRWNETRLLLEDVVSLMEKKPDVKMMFDFHPCFYDRDNPGEMQRFLAQLPSGEMRSRCIVESYSMANMAPVLEDGIVIPMFGWTPTRCNLSERESRITTVHGCVEWCKSNGVRLLSVHASFLKAHPEWAQDAKENGLVLYSAGWQSYADLGKAAEIGVDFATVDFLVPGGKIRNKIQLKAHGAWRRMMRGLDRIALGGVRWWWGGGKKLAPISTAGMQEVTLQLMKDIHAFCEKNGLVYFLAYGSLLGAVRHKGPIPWDDDMDIYMPRPDYERFVKTFPDSWRARLVSPERGNAPMPFARYVDTLRTWAVAAWTFAPGPTGCCIDIFPLDGAEPDVTEHNEKMRRFNDIKRKLVVLRLRLSWILSKASRIRRRNLPKTILKSQFLYPLHKKRWLREAGEIMLSVPYETASWVTSYLDSDHRDRVHMPKKWFSEKVLVKYADAEFYAPIGWDDYLHQYFGDYMTPPPESGRTKSHFMKVGWLA